MSLEMYWTAAQALSLSSRVMVIAFVLVELCTWSVSKKNLGDVAAVCLTNKILCLLLVQESASSRLQHPTEISLNTIEQVPNLICLCHFLKLRLHH